MIVVVSTSDLVDSFDSVCVRLDFGTLAPVVSWGLLLPPSFSVLSCETSSRHNPLRSVHIPGNSLHIA